MYSSWHQDGWIDLRRCRRGEKRESVRVRVRVRETDNRGRDWVWYAYGMVPQSGLVPGGSLAGNVGVGNRSGKVNQVRYVL